MTMTQIRMLETRRGSPDGFVVKQYLRDRSYDVPDMMASAFIANGWAVRDPVVDEIAAENRRASQLTQGELLKILGTIKHAFPDARIAVNPLNGGDHA